MRDIRQSLGGLDTYAYRTRHTLRWNEFDRFGHLNNVVYYSLCDTALGDFHAKLGVSLQSVEGAPTQNVTVDGRCVYFASVFDEDALDIGVSVAKIGTSGITYQLGIFGRDAEPRAQGQFTEVLINTSDLKARPLTDGIKVALLKFLR